MKLLALPIALAIAANASGEILYRVSDSFWVWDGGSAYRSGNLWVGGGWDTFPGVSPPWNPVTPPPPLLPRGRHGMPPACDAPAAPWPNFYPPAPRVPITPYIRIGNELIPQVPSL
jgi:hypothetical protein